MDIEYIKAGLVSNVYHIHYDKKTPLHKHSGYDEVFYCIKGSGFGVLEDKEIPMKVGDTFIVRSETMHSVRSDNEMYVCSFLIPSKMQKD